ncbi:MAG: Zn-ribbon domain-containing OB-fold protein [Candidatus Thermoplasmatota archaeon]|nr:Zn-ribbon domain-containing OB-fold protein [Candidatus Thermoplasmatota archaeon]MCL5665335.1 Zn-ribbon domain-containing OB-fold protein [Candidatus Thermoplasmatota archaeon]
MGELSRIWRESDHRYRLIGHVCRNCNTVYFPPRDICPTCHRDSVGKMEEIQLSGKGSIFSYTVVHDAPPAFRRQRPYIIALIKLDEGPTLTAQIVDTKPENVSSGKRVHAVFRKIREDGSGGILQYGYKFVIDEPPKA